MSSSSPVAPTSNIISPEPNSPLPSPPPSSQSMDLPSSASASSPPRPTTAAPPEPPQLPDPEPTSTSALPPPAPASNSPIIPSLPSPTAPSPSPGPPPPQSPSPPPSASSSLPPSASALTSLNQPLFSFVRPSDRPAQQSQLSIAPLISNAAATFIPTADGPATTSRPSSPNQPITETAASVGPSPTAFVNPLSAIKVSQTTRGTASSSIPVPGLGNVSENISKSGEGVDIGVIVGIVVGSIAGAALLVSLAVCWIRRKKLGGKKESDSVGRTLFGNKEVPETQSFLVADEAASSSTVSGVSASSSVMVPADDGSDARFLSHDSNQTAVPRDASQHEHARLSSSTGTVPIAAKTKRESKYQLGKKKVSKKTSESGSSLSERTVVTPADISRAYQQHRPKPTVQQIVTSDNAPLLAQSGQISSAGGVSESEQNQALFPVYGISQEMAQQYMYGMTYEQQQEQLRYYMQNQAYHSPPDMSGMSQEYINSWWQAFFQHDPVAAQECYEAALKAQRGG
ncbi:hypothetical protein BJ741DRAFT_604308 [Chytriomyces cf. hyalinus JEL632]|nr:hypothetical protein BJ741DRAFT_604308 [Chytriomyces cf. hyalinus JEL632]